MTKDATGKALLAKCKSCGAPGIILEDQGIGDVCCSRYPRDCRNSGIHYSGKCHRSKKAAVRKWNLYQDPKTKFEVRFHYYFEAWDGMDYTDHSTEDIYDLFEDAKACCRKYEQEMKSRNYYFYVSEVEA